VTCPVWTASEWSIRYDQKNLNRSSSNYLYAIFIHTPLHFTVITLEETDYKLQNILKFDITNVRDKQEMRVAPCKE